MVGRYVSRSNRPRYLSAPSFLPYQPTNPLHAVMIPPPSQLCCMVSCEVPVRLVKRSLVAPEDLMSRGGSGITARISLALSRISDIRLLLKGSRAALRILGSGSSGHSDSRVLRQ